MDPTRLGAGERRPALGRNVLALSAVSFLTDVSSEMIYPLLPLFLTTVLGASAGAIGAIEGAAESTAALLKLASGWWSDRVARRKPLVVAGYALASIARPLVGVAGSAAQVLAVRLVDRVGKGIRSSPRDALIADSVSPALRGRAFGFHRAADHAGAVVGPLLAFALLRWAGVPLRAVFWLAAVPGALAVLVLVTMVREAPRAGAPPRAHDRAAEDSEHNRSRSPGADRAPGMTPDTAVRAGASPVSPLATPLGARFWSFLGAVALFTLGNSTDAFLLLRATDLGVPVAAVPLLWAAFHVVKSAASTPGGALSDRLGRRPLYAAVYFAFGRASAAWHAWALFGAYGVFFGLTEGAEKALVADLVPAARRGAAFGWYNLAVGLVALPASLLFGLVWQRFGATRAFEMGAALALAATVALVAALSGRRDAAARG
jgi:MFS family permease